MASNSKKEEKAEVVVAQNTLPVGFDAATLAADAGIGREQITSKDLAIPFLSVLQALSPQVKRGTGIEGAQEGDFFNTVTSELFDGPEGVVLVPCAYQRANVEWAPRDSGGGFVASHSSDEIFSTCHRDEKGYDVLPNGNIVVATAYHYCMLLIDGKESQPQPVILSLSRTQGKKSRKWNSMMAAVQVPVGDKFFTPPQFAVKWKIYTVPESKKDYSWFGVEFEKIGLISDPELYAKCKKFALEVSSGLVKAATPPADGDGEVIDKDIPF